MGTTMQRRVFLTILIAATVATAAAARDATPIGDLEAVLARFLAENPTVPGIVAQVTCPRLGLDWAGAVGTVARDSDEPLTPAHTFRIASNTKTYVSAAVLRLTEQGRLGLDDPLAEHLTAHEHEVLVADGYRPGAMTLRQVLSHTSGLDEHSGDPRYGEAILADPQHRWTREEQLQKLVEWCDPVGEPGAQFRYSDTGYVLLGGIVERVTGQELGAAVHALLDYERLGLKATWWEQEESVPPAAGPRAHQYYGEHDTLGWDPSLDLYGGGGLCTDVRDLARFTRLLLNGRVLRCEATLAAMTGDGTPAYRLGLMVVDLNGHMAWGHQGFWNTFVFHVPALDLTVAGSILDHHATNGRELAADLVAALDGR